MVNRDAPYSGLANLMAMNGRFGDTELVHMSKPEIRGLASLGELTINPDTGLPEAFSLGNILPLAINIGLGAATGGMSTFAQAAIMGGVNLAMGLAQDKSFGDALFGAALGAAGPALMRGITGAAGASGVAPTGVESSLASSASPTFTEGALALPTDAQIMAGITPPGFGGVSTDAFFTDAISTHGGELGGVGQGMGSVSPPTPSFGSKIANWIGDNPLEATGVGGLGLAGLAALSGGEEEEVDVIEEEIQPLPRSEFTGHKTRGPFTEQQLLDLALRGGAALDDDDIDEDGQLAFDFFTPGSYTRKNDGGLVGIPQTKQRSNVTNFMLAEDKGMPSSLSVFELGKSLGNMGKEQPNSGIMQLAVGGQPKSNIAQMLNPTLKRQAPTPSLNYDELRRRAYLQGENSPLNIYQTQHEDILRDTLGRIVEDSRKEVIETPEEPVAPVAPIPKPVNVFSDDGDPDTAGMSGDDIAGPGVAAAMGMADTEADVGAAAEAAEAAADEEDDVGEDEGEASLSRGGIVGLAKGGRVSPTLDYVLSVIESKGGRSDATGKKNIKDFFEILSIIESGNKGRFKQEDVRGKDTNKKRGNNLKIGTNLAGSSAAGYFQFLNNDGTVEDYDSEFASEEGGEGFKDSSLNTAINRLKTIQGLSNKSKKNNKKSSKLPTKFKKLLESRDKDISTLGYDDQFDLALANIQQTKKKTGVPGTDELLARISRGDKDAALTTYLKYHLVDEGQGKMITPKAKGIFSSLGRQPDPREYTLRGETVTDIEERLKSTPRSRMIDTYRPDSQLPKREQEGPAEGMSLIERIQSILPLSEGGTIDQYFEGQVVGRGDGMSDQIMFEVQGKKPDKALLSKDEYVLPADMVSILGNGSSNAGAEVLDQFVKDTRQKGFGTQRQQRQINPQKGLSALV